MLIFQWLFRDSFLRRGSGSLGHEPAYETRARITGKRFLLAFAIAGLCFISVPSWARIVSTWQFPNVNPKAEMDQTTDSCYQCSLDQLTETISIRVTNQTASTYQCDGIIRFYSLTTGSASAFPVSDAATVGPGATVTIVKAVHSFSDGSALDVLNSGVKCGEQVGTGTSSEGNVGTVARLLAIDGSASFALNLSQRTADLYVEEVANYATAGISGTLRLELWATTTSYNGGSLKGYKIAAYRLGELKAGYAFSRIQKTVAITSVPPPGNYYMTYLLTEYDSVSCTSEDKFCIVDYAAFNGTSTFPAIQSDPFASGGSTSTNSGGSGDGGGGGGGGAISITMIIGLIGLLCLRKFRRPARRRGDRPLLG